MGDNHSYIHGTFRYWLIAVWLSFGLWAQAQVDDPVYMYQSRLSQYLKDGDSNGSATALCQLALHHLGQHDDDNAVYFFRQAASKALQAKNFKLLGECYYHLGEVSHHYQGREAVTEALVNLNKAIQVQRSIPDSMGEVRSLMLKGKVYYEAAEFTKAAIALEEAEIKAYHLKLTQEKSELLQLMSKVYQKLDDPNKSLLYHDLFMGVDLQKQEEILKRDRQLEKTVTLDQVIIDSLEQDRMMKESEIADLIQNAQQAKVKLYQLESELTQKELALNKEKHDKLQERYFFEKWLRAALTAFVAASIILIIVLIRVNLKKTKANEFLGEQKRQVEKDAIKLKKENSNFLANQDVLKGAKLSLERELKELKILNEAHLQLIESTQMSGIDKVDQILNLVRNFDYQGSPISSSDIKDAVDNLLEIRQSLVGQEDTKPKILD